MKVPARHVSVWFGVVVSGWLAGAACAQPPAPPAGTESFPSRTLSLRQVDEAISRGLRSLAPYLSPQGKVASRVYRYQDGGVEALLALAALEAGGDPNAPGLAVLLEQLERQNPKRTAARALRAMVFARVGPLRRKNLRADLRWLRLAQREDGGWGETPAVASDLFDSALAMLALGQTDRSGAAVPPAVWDRARQFLLAAQNADGGYGYQRPAGNPPALRGRSHGSATAAAAVMWGVLIDRKQLPPPDDANHPLWACFFRTARWLEQHYDLNTVPEWYWGDAPEYAYRFLLLQAVPALKLSRNEWANLPGQLAAVLLDRRKNDGLWNGQPLAEDPCVATAWAVLSLCRVRQEFRTSSPAPARLAGTVEPRLRLVIGRVRHGGDWDVFPRTEEQWSEALASAFSVGLVRRDIFAGQDYHSAAVLVRLTGTRLEGFGAPAREALQTYLRRGGMVLIDSARGEEAFFEQARDLLERLFGPGSVTLLPADSPLLTGRFAGGVGNDVSRVRFVAGNSAAAGEGPPALWAAREETGRIVAILSRHSLAIPAEGEPPPSAGYSPSDASRIALNILLYAHAARQQALEDEATAAKAARK